MEKVYKAIDAMKGYALELQKHMVAIPAISPTFGGEGELKKAQYLESELKKLKFDEIIHVDAKDERALSQTRPNIVARYFGKDKTKTLWIIAHTDIVPEGDRTLWKTDPFELAVDADGDTIYGRGVEDNHHAIIAGFMAARAVMESGVKPPVNIGLMLLCDEEVEEGYGVEEVIKRRRDLFGEKDSFLVMDSGDAQGQTVEIAEKTILWTKFTVTGKQCHASMPEEGNNALLASSNLIVRLHGGLYAKFDRKDDLFSPANSTFEPTKKEAGVPNINTIPGTDAFYMDCRFLPSYDTKEVVAEIKKITESVEKEFGVQVKFEVVQNLASLPTKKDAPIVQKYCLAVKDIYKTEPKIMGVGGGTFASFIRNLGLPAVVGSKIYEEPHSPNERAKLSFAQDEAKAICHVLANL